MNEDLKKEWEKYRSETGNHVRTVRQMFDDLDMDESRETPGRDVVRHKGQALLEAMKMAADAGDEVAAQLVAAECVVDAETKDHANWELIGRIAVEATGDKKSPLGRLRAGGRGRGHASLLHHGLGPGSCGSSARDESGATAARRGEKVTTAIGAFRAEQSATTCSSHAHPAASGSSCQR